jgi:hypothetical protein
MKRSNGRQYSYETLGISWVNGLSLFGAFWVPIIFSLAIVFFRWVHNPGEPDAERITGDRC